MESISAINSQIQGGLELLLRAHVCAEDANLDPWQFAVEIRLLIDAGLSATHLRWLTSRRYVKTADEVTPAGDDLRLFRTRGQFTFGARTRVILTETGVPFARGVCRATDPMRLENSANGRTDAAPFLKPEYNTGLGELRLGGVLVKGFSQAAEVQRLLLQSLQELGWPPRIDDPLPQACARKPKERLRAAISRLNRRQANPRIRFFSDGNGRGVCWKIAARPATKPKQKK